MADTSSSIQVCVRVRPFTIKEAAQLSHSSDGHVFLGDGSLAGAPAPKLLQKGLRSIIKVVDDKCLVFDPPEDNPVQKFSKSLVPQGKRVKDQTFGFDRVFDENVSQGDVYEGTTRSLLDSVFDGFNATVFAYGATGCGKTHTITGTVQQPGIIFLTMQELFERIADQSEDKVSEISLSYLEIYNETIRDLLVPGGGKGGLMLREDAHQAVSVSGLSSHRPQNVQQVMDMIVRGNECRTMSPTEANATSSRSHAVLQINVSQRDRNADVNEPHTMATFSIIDLAGSERASATKNRGERLIEGANINRSLLALGSCINALCDPRKKNHVPYRNSKLTRLLKFSLGGNCKTVMIVCVSPSSAHFDETQNTLRYANRAKNIQTKVTRNVFNVNRHVKDFLVKIDEQMVLINELKQQQKDYEAVAFAKFRKNAEKREVIAREGVARIRKAYEDSAAERLEKLSNMKKQRQIERRISMISTWISALDEVNDSQEDDNHLQSLAAVRKAAQGILLELEGSRHHYHQRISKNNWQRALDSALQNGVRQLAESEGGADWYDSATLQREAELLKSNAEKEALVAVAEQDKASDAPTVQVLLKAHFEAIAAIRNLMTMNEDEALEMATKILGQVLQTCHNVTSHVVKPDGSIAPIEHFPPSKAGTPKRKKAIATVSGTPLKFANTAALTQAPHLAGSPLKGSPVRASPKRRKLGGAKKGVTFTPKKKSPSKAKRGVRWRDDIQEGGLADFEKTPQRLESTPEEPTVETLTQIQPPSSAFLPPMADPSKLPGSSPIPTPPEASSDLKGKSSRFKAGFLSKKSNGSPRALISTLGSSDSDNSPLRDMEPGKVNNRSPRHYMEAAMEKLLTNDDRNHNEASMSSGSENESRWKPEGATVADGMGIRVARTRTSIPPGSGAATIRVQRRRSPNGASSGSPPGEGGMFTASHARRMVAKGEKENEWKSNVLSPRTVAISKAAAARRTTMSGESRSRDVSAGSRESSVRLSMTTASSGGSVRGSLVPAKGAWR